MTKRRLAAIMFTDIVGYDSLLKEDERIAFETRKKNQRIHRRLIKKFNGRWLKEMDSGTLASFNSIIDAVSCALSIQKSTTELNIPVRIGIHLGEVIFEKKDVLGDGVNIASRIHSFLDTHGIVISDTVHKDIRNKEGLEIESVGTQTLKGVDFPIGIYKVACEDENLLDFTIDTGELARPFILRRTSLVAGIMVIAILAFALYYFLPRFTQSSSKLGRSVLILPFENMTSDTLDYFAEGMHDILIGNVGKISALRVLGQTTANTYKDTEKSLTEIATERDVNTFVKGAVLCVGDNICLQLKLLDQDGNEVWTQDFEVESSQILNLYNTVTKEISSELGVLLTSEEKRLLAKSRTVNRQAYNDYLKGYQTNFSLDSLNKQKEFLESAIEKDPNWAPLYASLARVWLGLQHLGWVSPSVASLKIYENLNKALELDPDLSDAHAFNAEIAHWMEWDWEKAEKEFIRALAINPNDAGTRICYAQFLATQQRNEEALMQGELAYDLDPLNPSMKILYGGLLTMVGNGDCETALALAEEVFAADSENIIAMSLKSAAAFKCGDYDKGIEADIHCLKAAGPNHFEEDTLEEIKRIYDEKGFSAAQEEIAHQWEVYAENNPLGFVDRALAYVKANKPDKAMDWIEWGFKIHDPQMIYITVYSFDPLYDNPRFIDIVEKMNLPLP